MAVLEYILPDGTRQVVTAATPLPTGGGSGGGTPPAQSNNTPDYTKGAYSQVTDATLGSTTAGAGAATGAAGTTTTLATFDAKDFQSVALGILVNSTFTGTLTWEESIDGVAWTQLVLVKRIDGTLSSAPGFVSAPAGLNSVWVGDVGARYIRVRQSAWTAGAVTIQALFSALSIATIPQQALAGALPAGANKIGMVVAVPNHANDQTSTTTNAAGATYTSGVVDQGTDSTIYGSRIRVGITHLAGVTHGHLTLEQSDDGTTYRETDRFPVPSDGYMHNFAFTIVSRYYRTKFVNGAVAQTTFYHHSYRIGVEGPSPDSGAKLAFPLSTTALGASATFTSPGLDLGNNHGWTSLRAHAFGDQAGTLSVQESADGSTWRAVRPFEAGLGATLSGVLVSTAASALEYGDFKILQRYVRVVYVNTTATAETVTTVGAVLMT